MSVAPRGASACSITDLLPREGALALLGTQVPVDVRRNRMLTGRLLTNLAGHLINQGRHATRLEVWRDTQTTNTANDILMSTIAAGQPCCKIRDQQIGRAAAQCPHLPGHPTSPR